MKRPKFHLDQNLRLALRSIKVNKLRSILTLVIIAVGIMALVGILTSLDAIEDRLRTSFAELGSNTFTIQNEGLLRGGPHGQRRQENRAITLYEAEEFKKRFKYPSTISLSYSASGFATLKSRTAETNPNVTVIGIDENYLKVFGYNIAEGRNLTGQDIAAGSNLILLGQDVVSNLYEDSDSVLYSLLSIGNIRYRVVGLLQSKGASTVSNDNRVLISYNNARRAFPSRENFQVSVSVEDASILDLAIDEAKGQMRSIRRLSLAEQNDFSVSKSDRLANAVLSQLSFIGIAAFGIGLMTLLGAGIGLMNIMLVSVNERTREIGVSKALGATREAIVGQFLTEAVVICQIGGLIGIVLGIAVGNVVAMIFESRFILPWQWMIVAVIFCFIVGIAAGIYPALRAGRLNPVEALRYE